MAPTCKVVFHIPPSLHMLDMSGPSQAFLAAGQLLGGYPIEYCSFREEIVDSSGLRLSGLKHYTAVDLQAGDLLFLPGYQSQVLLADKDNPEWEGVYAWLRHEAAKGVRLCAVCSGAFLLARAGLLTGRFCTTHWSLIAAMRKEFPALDIRDDILFTEDGNLYTSAGISSGIDLALHLLDADQGSLFAHKISRELVVYFRRSDRHSQDSVYLSYRNHLHRGIHELQDWLIENLSRRATIDQMAEMVNMSSRNLTRTFKLQTGISINRYITLLRVELAGNLRYSPGITMRDIAGRCGFANERQLQRIMKSKNSLYK